MSGSIQTFDDLFSSASSEEEDEQDEEEENNSMQISNRSNKRKRSDQAIDYRGVAEEVIYECCSLPSDVRKESEKQRRYEQDGIYASNFECELCRIGNLSSNTKISKGIVKVYEIYQENFKVRSDMMVYQKMAITWNNKVYEPNIKLDPQNELNLTKVTVSIVQNHFENCMVNDINNMVWDDIMYFRDAKKLLRRSGNHIRNCSNGDIQTNQRGFKLYLDLHKATLNALDFLHKDKQRKTLGSRQQRQKY